ncbi:hypothetical protein FE782_28865 [Paenibacillus antri]|uniref:Uncharacterized protein n=1 Tax=Paenibacillus antri TaxID=2582848 RepID=A0A5R9G5I5_9BACL|nr:hypothetical protein [Paenibacillus antri]TLS48758.1 hypothetical protein FE782_28865 [Paenibacillus antri]
MNIQGISPAFFAVQGKTSAAQVGTVPDLRALTPIAISPVAYTKFDFLQRLRSSTDGGPADGTFLQRLAERYGALRTEIESGGAADSKDEWLTMLDEVYDEVAAEAADRLSGTFDVFFDFGSGRYGEAVDRFDRQAFKSHLLAMAQDAKSASASGAGSVEELLAAKYAASNRMESMSFTDVVRLSGAIRDILGAAPAIAGGDTKTYGAAVADWQSEASRRLDSAGLSDDAKSAAEAALREQAATRLKGGAFVRAVDSMREKIEESMRELARLNAQRAWIDRQLERLAKELPPGHPMLQQLLERERQLIEETKSESLRIKEMQEKRKGVVDDPSSVTELEEYAQVVGSYQERLSSAETRNEP